MNKIEEVVDCQLFVETQGFDVCRTEWTSAAIRSNKYVSLLLDELVIHTTQWSFFSTIRNFALSHTHRELGHFLIHTSVFPIDNYAFSFETTARVQMFISLLHLAGEVFEIRNRDGGETYAKINMDRILLGGVLRDNLPSHNRLIILPSEIQTILFESGQIAKMLMKQGLIYRFSISGNEGDYCDNHRYAFYYRPYNVPIIRGHTLGKQQSEMYNKIKKYYADLGSNLNI
ncbi:MAG: hypothetical protein WBB67_00240 [bacterium]